MKLKITVHGVSYEVDVEILDAGEGFPTSALPSRPAPHASSTPAPALAAPPRSEATPSPTGDAVHSVVSPIAGTVQEVKVKPGDSVSQGQTLMVIEAMKMNTSIAAPVAGKIKAVSAAAGDTVREGETLVEFE